VPRADGTAIDVYIASAVDAENAPTVVFFGGSKCLPVAMLGKNRTVSALMFFEHLSNHASKANVVVVEKRGLKSFGPPPASKDEAKKMMDEAFVGGLLYLKDTRVDDGVAVVRALLAEKAFRRVHLAGHSEGGDVITGVAKALKGKGVLSVGLMAGAGPTRFFETGQLARKDGGAAGIKAVFDQEIALAANPSGGPDEMQSVTYALRSSPLDDLRGLKVPVFMAHGDEDEKAPVSAADAFAAELFRDPGQPLTYLMLPGLDHSFTDKAGKDHSGDLLEYYLAWVLRGGYPRVVITGLPAKAK
jgi:hypothetical protein